MMGSMIECRAVDVESFDLKPSLSGLRIGMIFAVFHVVGIMLLFTMLLKSFVMMDKEW